MGPEFTQARFAELVGFSTSAIQRIELGDLEVSEKLALRITAATGVREDSITGKSGHPTDLLGNPYSAEFYRLYSMEDSAESQHDFRTIVPLVTAYLHNTLAAAQEKHRLHALLLSLGKWLRDSLDEFKLRATADRMFREWKEELESAAPPEMRADIRAFPSRIMEGTLASPFLEKTKRVAYKELNKRFNFDKMASDPDWQDFIKEQEKSAKKDPPPNR